MNQLRKYPRATLLTIYSLGLFLGLLHIFFGVVSLSPMLSQEYHREMKISFNAYSKSLSFLHQFVDRVTLALYLRYLVAGLQLLFGGLILENNYFDVKLSSIANWGLAFLDLNIFFMQISIKTSFERIAPNLVFLVLLLTRLIILDKASSRKVTSKAQSKSTTKPKTSTPKKNKNE